MKSMLVALLGLLLIGGIASAQTGTVTGAVVDDEGVPVEGARVSLWLDGHCDGYVLTDAAGTFSLADIDVGTYTLKVGKPKVGQAILEGVVVLDGEVTDVGVITLVGGGPHGPGGGGGGGGKYRYQEQNQNQNQSQHQNGQE